MDAICRSERGLRTEGMVPRKDEKIILSKRALMYNSVTDKVRMKGIAVIFAEVEDEKNINVYGFDGGGRPSVSFGGGADH